VRSRRDVVSGTARICRVCRAWCELRRRNTGIKMGCVASGKRELRRRNTELHRKTTHLRRGGAKYPTAAPTFHSRKLHTEYIRRKIHGGRRASPVFTGGIYFVWCRARVKLSSAHRRIYRWHIAEGETVRPEPHTARTVHITQSGRPPLKKLLFLQRI